MTLSPDIPRIRISIKPMGYRRRTRQGRFSAEAMEYHRWMESVKILVRQAAGVPVQLGGVVKLAFHFATHHRRKWGEPKTTRPDVDNLAKAVIDALADGNDSHVWRIEASKFWAEEDWIVILEGLEHQRDET